MKALLAIALLAVASNVIGNEFKLPVADSVRSVSGQFVIYDRCGDNPALPPRLNEDPELVELTPKLLVVSCERIKQALYAELNASRDWRGNIFVNLRPGGNLTTPPQISGEPFGTRWNYRVELPQRVGRSAYVRALVHVVLLEMANRQAVGRSAEIPLWLIEGFTQRLLASREVELILPPPTATVGTIALTRTLQEKRDPDPLAEARRILREYPAATIEELSWPTPETFNRTQAEVFQASAHLLVAELLRLERGPELLRNFVASLARFYNWQPALQHVYHNHFDSQLAFAKWWTLQAAYFVGRDNKQLWTIEESADQLDQLLHASVAVRVTTNDLPVRTQVKLQTIIAEWNTVRQMEFLPGKIRELDHARVRVAPEFIALVHEYQVALTDYIKQRQRSTTTFTDIRNLPPSIQRVARDAIQKLDALDARRTAILAQSKESGATTASFGVR